MYTEKGILKFAFYSSILMIILTIITWGFAMIAVPPAGPYCPGNCMDYPYDDLLTYYPRDYYWMYFAVIQLFVYMIFIISNYYLATNESKIFSSISIAFALISTIVLLITYFVQFSVVPISMIQGEKDGIALITQYNGHGIFIAMEELGYITMSISFLFLGLIFTSKNRLEKVTRVILLLSFLFTVLSFAYYSLRYGIDRNYRFEVAVITINWLTTITIGILVSIIIQNRLKIIK